MIRVLRKVVHVVDDGWWEGELDGRTGLFPSLVVEECREDGEPLTPQVMCTIMTNPLALNPKLQHRSLLVISQLNPIHIMSNPSFHLSLKCPSGSRCLSSMCDCH